MCSHFEFADGETGSASQADQQARFQDYHRQREQDQYDQQTQAQLAAIQGVERRYGEMAGGRQALLSRNEAEMRGYQRPRGAEDLYDETMAGTLAEMESAADIAGSAIAGQRAGQHTFSGLQTANPDLYDTNTGPGSASPAYQAPQAPYAGIPLRQRQSYLQGAGVGELISDQTAAVMGPTGPTGQSSLFGRYQQGMDLEQFKLDVRDGSIDAERLIDLIGMLQRQLQN